MFVLKYKNIFLILSALLILLSVIAMVVYGFNFGIDFKGGTILEVSYLNGRPQQETVKAKIDTLNIGAYLLRATGDNNFNVKTKALSNAEKDLLVGALNDGGKVSIHEERFTTVGPVIGKELRNKAYMAISLVILGIVIFVTFAFRKVSEPVASWKYGLATIIALVHDVIIPTGVFVILGKLYGVEIDLLFVSGILAILGYSVHDTIVVFDRVRENLRINKESRQKINFETIVGKSVSETFGRSINTSLTIFLVLIALYFLGGEATKYFSLLLLVGVIVGTYSSIFVANPLLVLFEKFQKRGS